jgi:hypothetical protein
MRGPSAKRHPKRDVKRKKQHGVVVIVQTASAPTPLVSPPKRVEARKARVLAQYRVVGSVRGACAAARIGRRTFYNWVEEDRDFAGQLQDVRDDLTDELEELAHKRAMAGSDRLLIYLLGANRPWKYRANAMVTSVSPIVKEHVRETVQIVRAELPKADADRVLARLNSVWQ